MPEQPVDQLLERARGLLRSLEKRERQALTLPAPFAAMVAEGKVTLIIADKQMDIAERDLLLADSETIYGEVRLKRGKPISLAEFRKREREHRIPDEERKSAWPTARRLFAYQVESVKAKKPCKRPKKPKNRSHSYAMKAFEAVMKGKRQPTAAQLAKLKEGEDISVFAEIFATAPTLREVAKRHAQTTIELMEPGEEAGDILFNVAPMAELLEEEFSRLAKRLEVEDWSEGPNDERNAFVLADDMLEALQLADKMLPEKSRQAALTKAAIEVMEAFLELEPDFQEASRCPELVGKEEMTTDDVPTAHQPNPPPPKEPQAPKECVCPECGHKEKLAPGEMCSGKKCPECGTPMKRNTQMAKAEGEMLARLDDLDSTMINPGWIKNSTAEQYQTLSTDQLLALKAMLMYMLRPEEEDQQLAAIGILAGYEGFDEDGFPRDVTSQDVKKALGLVDAELAKRDDVPDDQNYEDVGILDPEYQTQFVDLEKQEGMVVQTLIFDKQIFDSKDKVRAWVRSHGFKVLGKAEGEPDAVLKPGIDETGNSYRVRQRPPSDFQPGTLRTISITEGVKAVVGRLKTSARKAVWDTAYVNNLPDSAFLYIAPGGKKDGEGKTVPRSLRYFPVRDDSGKLDLPHLRNAIARIPQSNAPGLNDGKKRQLQEQARRMLAEATNKGDREEEDAAIIEMGDTEEILVLDLEKAGNAFTQFSGAERVLPAVFQLHFRGKTAHGDFRVQVANHLIGYTMALQQAGKVSALADLKAAKALVKQFGVDGSPWSKSMVSPSGVYAALKNPHPASWLKVHNRQFEPGEVGASTSHPGFMLTVAKPRVARGYAGQEYHEYFLEKAQGFQGRLIFTRITRKGPGAVYWKAMFTDDLLPYVVSARAVHKGRIGPKGWSLLPPMLKAVVPASRRYWLAETEKERKDIRRALVKEKFFTRQNIKLVDGELRKVRAKYFLYQPEQEAAVGKQAGAMAQPAPPTASQDNGETETGQEKTEGLSDFVTELKKAEASVRSYIKKASVRVFKYHTVDGINGEEERYLLGEVLVPDDEDTQGDEYDESDVRKAAHFFAEHGFFAVGLMHERTLARSKIRVLESYLAPIDMTIEGRDVKKGTWLLAARVLDDDLWQAVKDGTLTGWSIEGTAIAEEIS